MDQATKQPPPIVTAPCYHCGESIPGGTHYGADIDGEFRPMCCPGCTAVAQLIASSGLESFYRQRTAYSEKPDEQDTLQDNFVVYDDPELVSGFVTEGTGGSRHAALLVDGMNCAACTWLIEQSLGAMPGVVNASVNLQQSRLNVEFDAQACKPSELMRSIASLGYNPLPWQASALRDQLERENRADLRRLAVAALAMMQVGMFAVALHAGDIQGIDSRYQGLLRWVSLPVAAFVIIYSAQPFFTSAWRHLRQGSLVMDLPVALAISIAFTASTWATLSGTGQVYFDSVVMFTFFLLLARYLEKRVRARHSLDWAQVQDCLPAAAHVQRNGLWLQMPRQQLRAADRFLVRAGETVPLDGTIELGSSAVSETAFNGEELPRPVAPGDTVYAGSVNIDQVLEVTATCEHQQTRLAALQRSLSSANSAKPRIAAIADRVASWFVGAILLASTLTAIAWLQIDPQRALWIALSVLVISCPCALAIATPAALAGAATALRKRGIIVHGENALQALSKATDIVFDKTGTLTRGELGLATTRVLGSLSAQQAQATAAALQQYSTHPAARAFRDIEPASGTSQIQTVPGAGVAASIAGTAYRIGSREFCNELVPMPAQPDDKHYWVGLCNELEPLAWLGLTDSLRPEAPGVIDHLRSTGLVLHLLTGDSSSQGAKLAAQLGIENVRTGQSPEQKMQAVDQLHKQASSVVVMVGDGLNDAPVLGLANVSFAVAGATDLARTQADFVICDGDLGQITSTINMAEKCRRVILQNLGWALAYNLCAIPLAALGYVPPWAAALGMSGSSLLVVANSLRLRAPPAAQKA